MAIAIISDIHGNIEALDAVLNDISEQEQKHGIKEIHCLGDIVGYGPDPAECIQRVREHCSVVIGGSHEESVCYIPKGVMASLYSINAVPSILWTRRLLHTTAKELVVYISKLPYVKLPNADDEQKRIAEVHGTLCHAMQDYDSIMWKKRHPNNPPHGTIACASINGYATIADNYPEGENNVGRCFASLQKISRAVCFVGHSHVAEAFCWNPEKQNFNHVPVKGKQDCWKSESIELKLVSGNYYVINPGSVGQPRDEDSRASYCIYKNDRVICRKVPYEVVDTMRKIMRITELNENLRAYLAARLLVGH
ncbi:MAG: metallophosphoesterase family protein [Candidatus Woesearchaeota archaeon]